MPYLLLSHVYTYIVTLTLDIDIDVDTDKTDRKTNPSFPFFPWMDLTAA